MHLSGQNYSKCEGGHRKLFIMTPQIQWPRSTLRYSMAVMICDLPGPLKERQLTSARPTSPKCGINTTRSVQEWWCEQAKLTSLCCPSCCPRRGVNLKLIQSEHLYSDDFGGSEFDTKSIGILTWAWLDLNSSMVMENETYTCQHKMKMCELELNISTDPGALWVCFINI